jgi:adenylate kinase
MLNIVLFGPPGSGKGTQSLNIIRKYDLIHISTGDILREAVKNMTPVGIEAKAFLDKGELVPDEVVIKLLLEKVDNNLNSKGFVFDGFPRTIYQANRLDSILFDKKIPIDLVLAVDVDEEELYKRILGRKTTMDRSDDNESIIMHRLEVYKNQTLPLFDYYKKQDKLTSVNGMHSIDDVFESITKIIDSKLITNN